MSDITENRLADDIVLGVCTVILSKGIKAFV